MAQGPDVVIVDPAGTEHHFPPGFDPVKAAGIVKQGQPSSVQQPDWIDKMADWLPAAGGTVGGVVGTAGGPLGSVGGAMLGGMAGEAYKELITRARGRTAAPTSATTAAMQMGKEGAMQGGAQLVGAAVAPVAQAVGSRMMQSAVKPGLKYLVRAVKTGETPRVVQTLLDEGVNVSPGGVAKLQALVGSTNQEIRAAVDGIAGKISPLKVASRLNDTARTFANQVNPQADLEAISDVGQNFLEAHGGADLAPVAAQDLKTGTYARIGEKYGKSGAAGIEAEKALARGLKEELAQQATHISALNQREGALLESLNAVGKRVALAGNRDPVGFAWVAHNPTTFLAALMDRSPTIKSLVARGLYNHAGSIAQVPPALIRVAVHSLTTGDPDSAMSSNPGGAR